MARYTKDQLAGFVADPRYRDRKHPEHKAHLDFTVKAFEETYPDPVAPTPEQEEWAAAEEKRLRDLVALPAYRDKRDPDHAKTFADVTRGYDKLNAVLYGTPASEPERAETPKPVATRMSSSLARPASATTPAPDLFQRANQLAQAGQTAGDERFPVPYLRMPGLAAKTADFRSSGTGGVPEMRKREASTMLAESTNRPNPPKVIYPEITAPPGIDGDFIWSPKMVTPSQIETLWRDLDDPKGAFESFKKGFELEGTQVTDLATGKLRPPTENELEIWFKQWQDHIRDFLQDYYEKKDSLFPEESERVPPIMPIQPENPVG